MSSANLLQAANEQGPSTSAIIAHPQLVVLGFVAVLVGAALVHRLPHSRLARIPFVAAAAVFVTEFILLDAPHDATVLGIAFYALVCVLPPTASAIVSTLLARSPRRPPLRLHLFAATASLLGAVAALLVASVGLWIVIGVAGELLG